MHDDGLTETEFTETSGAIARAAELSQPTIQLYEKLGLLDCIRDSRGNRLFRPDAARRAREIWADRMTRRGQRAAS